MSTAPALFLCSRQAMSLTVKGCARLWESANAEAANPPKPWEGRSKCLNCTIGAQHAGRTVDTLAATRSLLKSICPRCTKLSDRIINTKDGHRLCISCANRHYEAFRRRPDGGLGCDAKGHRPRICDLLHQERVAVTSSDGVEQASIVAALCLTEVMISVAVKANAQTYFSRVAPNGLGFY